MDVDGEQVLTVEELVALLQQLPPTVPVAFADERGWQFVKKVTLDKYLGMRDRDVVFLEADEAD